MTSLVSPLARRVAEYVRSRELFESRARVLVAVSGGPDSCALLFALVEAAGANLLPRPVGVAHFHHGVRGRDADEEAGYVAGLCARFGLPCVIGLGHLPKRGGHYRSDVARRERYAFLQEAARDLGADTLATAHTQSDQAETVLWRIFRGTGLDGLGGIPTRRLSGASDDTALWLVRPLLDVSRDEVEAYCRTQNITPHHDPSNDEDYYARVRIRRLLPDLAHQFNPRLPDALARLAETARLDDDLLQSLAGQLWNDCARVNGVRVELRIESLVSAHAALRRRVLLRAIRRAFALAGSAEAEAAARSSTVARIETLLADAPERTLHLPGRLQATCQNGFLVLNVVPYPAEQEPATPVSLLLPVPGQTRFEPIRMTLHADVITVASGTPPIRQRRSRAVDMALPETVTALDVRAVRDGDRIAPLGMGGSTRLVRDVLAEAGVPPSARRLYPVVVQPGTGQIVWLVGLVQAESMRVMPELTRRVRLLATFDNEDAAL